MVRVHPDPPFNPLKLILSEDSENNQIDKKEFEESSGGIFKQMMRDQSEEPMGNNFAETLENTNLIKKNLSKNLIAKKDGG